MIQRIAQKAFIVNDKNEILLIKYLDSKFNPKKVLNKYGLPGGKIDIGENPDEALTREVLEETGVEVKPMEPFYIWDWKYTKDREQLHMVGIVRLAKVLNITGQKIQESTEGETIISKPVWINLKKLNSGNVISDEWTAFEIFLTQISPSTDFKPTGIT